MVHSFLSEELHATPDAGSVVDGALPKFTQVVAATAATTKTLPADTFEVQVVHVKWLGAGNIIVVPNGTDTIDGVSANYDFDDKVRPRVPALFSSLTAMPGGTH